MRRRVASVMFVMAMTAAVLSCGKKAEEAEEVVETVETTETVEPNEEVVEEPEVTVVGTEYVYAENDTHTLVTAYSDGTTETADAEECDYGETGTCSLCGHVYEIPEPVVTVFDEPADYVAVSWVNTYAADSKYADNNGTVGTDGEVKVVKVTGITENGWYQTEDGSFVKPEDLTERSAYEEANGRIYTVTWFDEPVTMYCQESSNIRVKPENDAEVAYKKATNDTLVVLGTCTENDGWYYLEDGCWTLKSNLGTEKYVAPVAPTPAPAATDNGSTGSSDSGSSGSTGSTGSSGYLYTDVMDAYNHNCEGVPMYSWYDCGSFFVRVMDSKTMEIPTTEVISCQENIKSRGYSRAQYGGCWLQNGKWMDFVTAY